MRTVLSLVLLAAATFASPPVHADELLGGTEIPDQAIQYLALPSKWGDRDVTIGARLLMPRQRTAKLPAVIVMHGTGGVSLRGVYYGNALSRAGIATLEVDQWGGRGIQGSPDGRPKTVHETLADVSAALDLLGSRPEIDSARIGILGFSWGGVVSMLVSTQRIAASLDKPGRPKIVAAMPFYPICYAYNRIPNYEFRDLSPIPVRIVTGEHDDYDKGAAPCRALIGSLPEQDRSHVSLVAYANAPHAFDGFVPAYVQNDPYGNLGKGGQVTIGVDSPARAAARDEVVGFFSKVLKP